MQRCRAEREQCLSLEKSWVGVPCSLSTWALLHRHESHTWSLERTESLTSDSQSGIMLSSVGTSKCNSPACVEARARRGATFCLEEQRRPTTQYRDSVDSLRDSPHSERSEPTACATPAQQRQAMPLCQAQKCSALPALEWRCHGRIGELPLWSYQRRPNSLWLGSSQLCTL